MDRADALLVLIILHLLVYPASNGYNSYMDRDTGSIGGLERPPQPTRQLFYISIVLDLLAIGLGWLITPVFAMGILLYISASRSYSYRRIRLKKYPVAGYLTVVIFQGAFTFFLVYHGCESSHALPVPGIPALAASLLIGGFYPLTQVYQHEADLADGVQTLSYKLGYRGTFLFTGIIYALAFTTLGIHYYSVHRPADFLLLQICMLPVIVYYMIWFRAVWLQPAKADYRNTMRMNMLASFCTNAAFILIIIKN